MTPVVLNRILAVLAWAGVFVAGVLTAKHYMHLPVLASIPELLTAAEAHAIPRRQKLVMAAGLAVTLLSVPTLAFVLRLTHVFEKFLL